MSDDQLRAAYEVMMADSSDGAWRNRDVEDLLAEMDEANAPDLLDRVREVFWRNEDIAAMERQRNATAAAELMNVNLDDPRSFSDDLKARAESFNMTPREYADWSTQAGGIRNAPSGLRLREKLWQEMASREGIEVADRVVGRPYDAEGGSLSIGDFTGLGVLDLADAVSKGGDISPGDALMGSLGLLDVAGGAMVGRSALDTLTNAARAKALPARTYATHEAVPYKAIGRNVGGRHVGVSDAPHLPGTQNMTPAEAEAFRQSRSWADPETGQDILLSAAGGDVLPTLTGQGRYAGPEGVEYNPLSIARVENVPWETMQTTESLRGLLDAQGGTPWTALKQGDAPVMFIPHEVGKGSADEIEKILGASKQFGATDVVDVGEGYVIADFDNFALNNSAKARRAVAKATGLKPISTTAGGGYPAYEGAWEEGGMRAVERYLSNVAEGDPELAQTLLENPGIRAAAAERSAKTFSDAKTMGGDNPSVRKVLDTVKRGQSLEDVSAKSAAAEIPRQIPDTLRGGGAPIEATHFSSERRGLLDPNAQFSNPSIRGEERNLPDPYPAQTYFGRDVGQPGGYVKEAGVGDVPHDVTLDASRMMDISGGYPEDVTALADQIIQRRLAAGEYIPDAAISNLRKAYQMQIAKQRGYEGLLNPTHELGSIATSFYPTTPR